MANNNSSCAAAERLPVCAHAPQRNRGERGAHERRVDGLARLFERFAVGGAAGLGAAAVHLLELPERLEGDVQQLRALNLAEVREQELARLCDALREAAVLALLGLLHLRHDATCARPCLSLLAHDLPAVASASAPSLAWTPKSARNTGGVVYERGHVGTRSTDVERTAHENAAGSTAGHVKSFENGGTAAAPQDERRTRGVGRERSRVEVDLDRVLLDRFHLDGPCSLQLGHAVHLGERDKVSLLKGQVLLLDAVHHGGSTL